MRHFVETRFVCVPVTRLENKGPQVLLGAALTNSNSTLNLWPRFLWGRVMQKAAVVILQAKCTRSSCHCTTIGIDCTNEWMHCRRKGWPRTNTQTVARVQGPNKKVHGTSQLEYCLHASQINQKIKCVFGSVAPSGQLIANGLHHMAKALPGQLPSGCFWRFEVDDLQYFLRI